MEKCYKVVSGINGRLWSSYILGKYQLEYQVGKITVPKIGKIFVFKTIEDAAKFYSNRAGECLFLYECECNELVKQHTRSCLINFQHSIEIFWNGLHNRCFEIHSPYQIYTTDYVKLVREVEWPE